jgi:hypothetical protein
MSEPKKRKPRRRKENARRGFKTFRASVEELRAVEQRAMKESIYSGSPVSSADIIRRGIGLVLASPIPGMKQEPEPSDCLVVDTVGEGKRCLTCKRDLVAFGTDPLVCAITNKEIVS